MGKGSIISGGEDGQYQIKVLFDIAAKELEIQRIEAMIASLNTKLLTTFEQKARSLIDLEIVSYQKRLSVINAIPDDKTVSAWCADFTENLTGEIGTIEVPGEIGTVNIHPGFDGKSAYVAADHGLHHATASLPPSGTFYNLAMLPGWQKWKPTFRYAVIDSLDAGLANITFENTTSSQQGLNINQSDTAEDVVIEYMDCNDSAFEVGDSVLVMFTGQDWAQPKIIGFKDNPQPCGGVLKISCGGLCFYWDIKNDSYLSGVLDFNGNAVSFPASESDISKAPTVSESANSLFTTSSYYYPSYPPITVWCSANTVNSNSIPNPYPDESGSTNNTSSRYCSNVSVVDYYDETYDIRVGKETHVGDKSQRITPRNISVNPQSFSVDLKQEQVDKTIKYHEGGGDQHLLTDRVLTEYKTTYTPFGQNNPSEIVLSLQNYDENSGVFETKMLFEHELDESSYNRVYGKYTETDLVQIWVTGAVKVERTEMDCSRFLLNNWWANNDGFIFEDEQTICNFHYDWYGHIVIDNTPTYEEITSFKIWASASRNLDTSIINPFDETTGGNFQDAVELLANTVKDIAELDLDDSEVFIPYFTIELS